jgi:tRNA 2-selenouridine synthase
MSKKVGVKEFLELSEHIPVVDVRSPKEFEIAHIPGAVSMPLFNNEERAQVGTRYKQAGRDFAVQLGLEFVGPKMADFAKEARRLTKNKEILVHCWRGGMRSGSMAWLFEMIGLKVTLLEGGYKAYRRYIRSQFEQEIPILILGGYTGSGKTEILHELQKQGQQIIDLEGIAHHKGSAFGTIGQEPQPTNEQFENNLAKEWMKLDFSRPVWLEDESITMGQCGIPHNLFTRMRNTQVFKIVIPKKIREERLVKEYANGDIPALRNAIGRITRKLGGLRAQQAMEALDKGDFLKVADITLEYYDKAYGFGVSKRDQQLVNEIHISEDDPKKTASQLYDLAELFNS